MAQAADHTRLVGQGLASGDLDGDGFMDIVTISNSKIPDAAPLTLRAPLTGTVFDATAFFLEAFTPVGPPSPPPFVMVWNGNGVDDGELTVEINSGGNGNAGVAIHPRGTIGITSGGAVNRDGIGAVVTFTTKSGKRQMTPVTGGASYASQDSLARHFEMGTEKKGRVEVLWPGGVRNVLHDVRPGERILFPEIPCSVDDSAADRSAYVACVHQALDELLAAGVLDHRASARFLSSALSAPGR